MRHHLCIGLTNQGSKNLGRQKIGWLAWAELGNKTMVFIKSPERAKYSFMQCGQTNVLL